MRLCCTAVELWWVICWKFWIQPTPPASGVPVGGYPVRIIFGFSKLESVSYRVGAVCVILRSAVLIQYRRVTDGRTDRHMTTAYTACARIVVHSKNNSNSSITGKNQLTFCTRWRRLSWRRWKFLYNITTTDKLKAKNKQNFYVDLDSIHQIFINRQ